MIPKKIWSLLFFFALVWFFPKNALAQSRVSTDTLRSVNLPTPTSTKIPATVIKPESLQLEKVTVPTKSPSVIYNETGQKNTTQTTSKDITDTKSPSDSSYNQQGQETGFSETKKQEPGSNNAVNPTPKVVYNKLQQKTNDTSSVLRSARDKIVSIFKGFFSFLGK